MIHRLVNGMDEIAKFNDMFDEIHTVEIKE
jgi:hypothetical protein